MKRPMRELHECQLLNMKHTARSYGQDYFEEILLEELGKLEHELPLQEMCSQGGWPEDDSLQLSISGTREVGDEVLVTIKCFFDEAVPTGCADIQHRASGMGEVELIVVPATGESLLILPKSDF